MEQKHFKYEGNVNLNLNKSLEDAEIINLEFLVPVRVLMKVGDKEISEMAHVDYVNKNLFFDKPQFNTEEVKAKFFQFMTEENTLPEDVYEADVYDDIEKAQEEHKKLMEENNA